MTNTNETADAEIQNAANILVQMAITPGDSHPVTSFKKMVTNTIVVKRVTVRIKPCVDTYSQIEMINMEISIGDIIVVFIYKVSSAIDTNCENYTIIAKIFTIDKTVALTFDMYRLIVHTIDADLLATILWNANTVYFQYYSTDKFTVIQRTLPTAFNGITHEVQQVANAVSTYFKRSSGIVFIYNPTPEFG